MPQYKYVALSPAGNRVSGTVEAYNDSEAVDIIKERYSVLLKLTQVRRSRSILSMEIGKPKLNKKAFTMICSQFAIILDAGIPIARAVRLVADKTTASRSCWMTWERTWRAGAACPPRSTTGARICCR